MITVRLMLTGGGTGGHVYPGLVVANAVRQMTEGETLWVGTSSGMECDIVRRSGLAFASISAGALRGRSPFGLAVGASAALLGFGQSMRIMRSFRPDVVLATGGYVCVPVVLAARLSRIPTMLYLPDIIPGLAVRFLGRIVDRIAVTSGESRRHLPASKVIITGYPVRSELRSRDRDGARMALGLPADEPVLLVLGGSRGALTINNCLGAGLDRLLGIGHVVHACGVDHIENLTRRRESLPSELKERYHLYPYLHDELADAMAASDLVVSRSGASVMGEYPAAGLPSILVPYPHAGAHQKHNADHLASHGAARIVSNDDARRGALVDLAATMLENEDLLFTMAEASRRLDRPEAASTISKELLSLRHESITTRLGVA
ncbi:MAG TPA: undecaprenyldiphospho-muramoylpentapeptide beta-N-acetylglucosaminyltransferase [Chloroflexota bacterium]|nr:undecaprenyldiphospho-muramoylpentapeptide beta-N-acetylglucosaminyltransferase [Chloroflexota bacterium]